jgi:hypothetical protein
VPVRGQRASPTTAPNSVLMLAGPSLVRKIASRKPGTRRSAQRGQREPGIVSQVRLHRQSAGNSAEEACAARVPLERPAGDQPVLINPIAKMTRAAASPSAPVRVKAVVDGTFIWTPSHDQRPRSLSTALPRLWLRSLSARNWWWSVRSEGRTNGLDGRRSVDLPGRGLLQSRRY